MGNFSLTKFFVLILMPIVVLVAAVGVAYYYYNKYEHTQLLLKNPQEAAKDEAKAIVGVVSKYMVLPANEQPTLATVTDSTKLSSQAFFKNSKNGDKVLIYIQAKEAILFRPDNKKIIAVAPISINDTNQAPQGKVAGDSTTKAPAAPTIPTVKPTVKPTTFIPLPSFTPAPTK